MHRTVPHAPPLALPALALLVVAACTSSSDGQGDAAPPTGTLPSRFSVLTVSDAQSGQTSVRVLDHDTGQLRTLVGGSAPLLQSSVELSPDGAHLAVVDSVAAGTRVRIVETATGTARTIDLDNGAPLPPPGGRGGDGSSARGGGTAGLVRFSPDGQRLLYLKRDAQLGGFRLELMEANGTGARTLPEPVRGEAFWLPDSARIAAVRHDTAIDAQVAAVYDFETLDRLVSAPALGDFAIVDALRVAADGSSIAYLGEVDVGTEGDWRVGVLNLDTGADAVFDPDVDELEDDRYFELSDDGRRVAFVGYTDDSSEMARVYVGHHGTGALVEASPGAAQARVRFLQWEPSGDRLAFASDHRQVDVEEIFVGDGLGPCDPIWTAVPDDGDVEQVEWSPAGGLIAIAREGAVTDDALFLFDADGVDEPVRVSFGGLAVETEDF
ncbi:MAG: WD40 repeat domain-containing protein, partial [Planctomycetota bacterium]